MTDIFSSAKQRENRLASLETKATVLMAMVAGLYAIGAPALWLLLHIANKIGALG